MSAIIEPASGTWWVSEPLGVQGGAHVHGESRGPQPHNHAALPRRAWQAPTRGPAAARACGLSSASSAVSPMAYLAMLLGFPLASIELTLDQLAEVEAALLNARLWLERATKQADELKAAEEVAQDEPQPLVCVRCEHPWHQGASCDDVCDCDDTPRCYRCNHPLMIHGRDGCRWRYICGCTVSNLTTAEQIREQP